jgi:hypothetical protein
MPPHCICQTSLGPKTEDVAVHLGGEPVQVVRGRAFHAHRDTVWITTVSPSK